MRFFEKYLSPGACKCLPPRGGVGGQCPPVSGGGGGGGFLLGMGSEKPRPFVNHRNFIMTGTSVYQNVMALHIALCLLNLFVSAYHPSATMDDKISVTMLPHLHLVIVACFGLYEVNTVHAVERQVQDVVSARYLSLIFSIICSIVSEVCYVLRDSIFGQVGWFISGILLHRCYEFTLPAIQSADLTVLSKQLCAEERTAKAYKTMFLKMVSLFLVFLFYVFIVGMAVASQHSFTQGLYNFGYLAGVLFIFELSLARFIYKSLYSQQDLAALAAILLLVSGHIFAYSGHIKPVDDSERSDVNIFARFLEYCAQFIVVTSVMKFENPIYFKRVDYT